MKNPETREMMAELYRLLERHEEPSDESAYWDSLIDGVAEVCKRHNTLLAFHMLNGLIEGQRAELRARERRATTAV
jgi:hypothetical protein